MLKKPPIQKTAQPFLLPPQEAGSVGVDQQAHRQSAYHWLIPPSIYPLSRPPCGYSTRDLELNETRSVLSVAGQAQPDHFLRLVQLQRVHG